MENENAKVKEYTRRAIANYRAKKDTITVLLDKGTKARIIDKYGDGVTMSAYVQKLIDDDLSAGKTTPPVSNPFED